MATIIIYTSALNFPYGNFIKKWSGPKWTVISHELLVIHLTLIILIELTGPCLTIHFGHQLKKAYKKNSNLLNLKGGWHRLPICFSFDSLSVKFCLFLFPLWSLSEQRLLYFVRRGIIFFFLERRNLNWVGINIYRLRYTTENIYTHYSTFLCNSFYIHPHFNWRPRVTGYSSVGAQIRHLAHGEGVTHLNSKWSYS